MPWKRRRGPGTARRAAVVFVLTAGASPTLGETPSFDYDRGRPLAVAPAEVSLQNVLFTDAAGRRSEATIVLPPGRGRHPGVLFVHWYAYAPSSNRTQFFPDALALAREGVVSLLVDTPWSDPRWFPARNPEDDFATSVTQVKNLRRALDVLVSHDRVDGRRIAYVGHDFGAMFGALVASSDRRLGALVFVAGTRAFSDWYLLSRDLPSRAAPPPPGRA